MVTRAVEYEQKSEPERLELKIEVFDEFVRKHEYWENSKQGKNYIAEIMGLSKRYGFKRRFLDLGLRGREKHFLLKDFVPGHLYEIVSTSVSRGKSYPRIQSIFECVYIGDKEILLREVFESEVVEQFRNYDLNVPRILVEQLLSNVSKDEAIRLIKEIS
jgi:hypothetical protein